MRKALLLFLILLGVAAAQTPAPITRVVVAVVGSKRVPQVDQTAHQLEQAVVQNAPRFGLDPAHLQVALLDYDDDASQVLQLQVSPQDLPYLAVIAAGRVQFSVKAVTDVDRTAAAAVRAARGLLATAGRGVAPSQPADPRAVALYRRLLGNPGVLGFHPTTQTVANVESDLKQYYVDPISDAQMEAGIKHQVAALLAAAGKSSSALDGLAMDSALPQHVVDAYGSQVPPDVLAWAEIQGALEPLDDPHTALLTPQQTAFLNTTLNESRYAGIGVSIELDRKHGNQLIVLGTLESSPAQQAGLQTGDAITAIDGVPTAGMNTELASSLIRGAVGNPVRLTVLRRGQTRDFSVTRAVLQQLTVSSRILPNNVGYLHLSNFGANSATEVEGVLLKWKMARVRGIIVDLRNDGGGYVKTAQALCSLFLPRGKLIMSMVGRGGRREALLSNGPGDYAFWPCVLLVNEYSASASEITAGCFKDNHLATLVGTHTFGKGSMQNPYAFPDQTELKITIARFYSPGGGIIDRLGIDPDVSVPMDPTLVGQPGDIQLQRAEQVLQSHM
ncbi:MAG: S41 family peptidase [Candidatus Xenobia bacterium]